MGSRVYSRASYPELPNNDPILCRMASPYFKMRWSLNLDLITKYSKNNIYRQVLVKWNLRVGEVGKGRSKKGGAGYEAATYFITLDVSEKYPINTHYSYNTTLYFFQRHVFWLKMIIITPSLQNLKSQSNVII